MTADELERIATFVKLVNQAERKCHVRIDLCGAYEDKYMRVWAENREDRDLEIEPRIGGDCLTLVRAEIR